MRLSQQQLDLIIFISKHKGQPHQMQKMIAHHFGISRPAIAKRVNSLRKLGLLNPSLSLNEEAFKTLENDQKL